MQIVNCLLLFLALLPVAALAQGAQDYGVVTQISRADMDRWLKAQVKQSGGEFENQRYHFIVGFSTGHYGSDPVHAIAMRRAAFGLLNNTFAVGDKVTPVAWEMSLWDVGPTIALTQDPADRARFVDAVPYAPMAGSRGGHDTERAVYDTLQQAVKKDEASSTIVLLLTNSNQSQVPQGSRDRLFGANNPQLKGALDRLGFRAPVRKSFSAETRQGTKTIDVTALFPKAIEPLAGAPTTSRYPTFPVETWQPAADRPAAAENLPNAAAPAEGGSQSGATTTPAAEVPQRPGFPWPLLLLGLLLILAVIAFLYWMSNRGPKQPKAAPVAAPPKGKPIPGTVNAVIGSAPRAARASLTDLSTISQWVLAQDGDAAPTLTPAPGEPPKGEVLAALSFDERRRLQVEAQGSTQFADLQGVNVADSDRSRLLIAPGERLVCRITSATTQRPPVRLELHYSEK